VALASGELAVADDDRPARQDDVGAALDLTALVARVVDVHVVGRRADRSLRRRIVDDEVRVGADRDRTFPGIHPEQLRWRRGDDVDPPLASHPAADDAAVVQQVNPVLDARQPVRNLPEVAFAKVLLALEVERAMIRRDDLQVVLDQPGPELVLVVGRPERRRAHELGALEAVAEVVEREEQVLGARLGERLGAAVAGVADGLECVPRGEVDDVDRDLGGLGEADDPVRRLALEDRIAGDPVVERIGLAVVHQVGRHDVDCEAVLGVHHDQPAVLAGLLHRPKDRPVVTVEDARIGREELEVGDALGDELVHLLERVVVDVAHDHVEAVVRDGVALGLGVPRIEAFAERLPARLDGKVHDRRGPAERRRARPRLERVLRERPAERQLHVGMDVDRARNHVPAARIDRLVGGHPRRRKPGANRRDRLAVDQDVCRVRAVRGDDRAVGDERAHRGRSSASVRQWRRRLMSDEHRTEAAWVATVSAGSERVHPGSSVFEGGPVKSGAGASATGVGRFAVPPAGPSTPPARSPRSALA
jgi:hypothetical protein